MEFKDWFLLHEKKKTTPAVHHDVDDWLKSVDGLKKELETLKDVMTKKQPAPDEKVPVKPADKKPEEKKPDDKDKKEGKPDEKGGNPGLSPKKPDDKGKQPQKPFPTKQQLFQGKRPQPEEKPDDKNKKPLPEKPAPEETPKPPVGKERQQRPSSFKMKLKDMMKREDDKLK